MAVKISFQICWPVMMSLANMQPSQQMCLYFFGDFAFVVAHPVAGVARDVEFTAGIGDDAVAAGFVVGAGAFDGGVVLSDVEIDGPRAQRFCEFLHGFVEGVGFPIEFFWNEAVLGFVVTERVKECVRHVGLETDELGLADFFE